MLIASYNPRLVYVREYTRVRFGRIEHVCSYIRRLFK